LEISEKRFAPVLKIQKTGVLLLNWPVCSKNKDGSAREGGDAMT
jgi:hypothetical protein